LEKDESEGMRREEGRGDHLVDSLLLPRRNFARLVVEGDEGGEEDLRTLRDLGVNELGTDLSRSNYISSVCSVEWDDGRVVCREEREARERERSRVQRRVERGEGKVEEGGKTHDRSRRI